MLIACTEKSKKKSEAKSNGKGQKRQRNIISGKVNKGRRNRANPVVNSIVAAVA